MVRLESTQRPAPVSQTVLGWQGPSEPKSGTTTFAKESDHESPIKTDDVRDCIELGTDRCRGVGSARSAAPPGSQDQPASVATPGSGSDPPSTPFSGCRSGAEVAFVQQGRTLKKRLQETTTGTKDPRTGQDLSKNANPGSGLPGGKDLSKEFPSGEQQWNDRLKGSLGAAPIT